MSLNWRIGDYMDDDTAYLMGLIVARGRYMAGESGRRIVIEWSYPMFGVGGGSAAVAKSRDVQLQVYRVRERIETLVGGGMEVVATPEGVNLILHFAQPNMVWRALEMHAEGRHGYQDLRIPQAIMDPEAPESWAREFVRGFADVAGKVRESDRDQVGFYRVRLDILTPNWRLPVPLCHLLQHRLHVPVQAINWGHPNLRGSIKEHQIDVYCSNFLKVGFFVEHKQQKLEELAAVDKAKGKPNSQAGPCPGARRIRVKPKSQLEKDPRLAKEVRAHFDSYWQICRALGCREAEATHTAIPSVLPIK